MGGHLQRPAEAPGAPRPHLRGGRGAAVLQLRRAVVLLRPGPGVARAGARPVHRRLPGRHRAHRPAHLAHDLWDLPVQPPLADAPPGDAVGPPRQPGDAPRSRARTPHRRLARQPLRRHAPHDLAPRRLSHHHRAGLRPVVLRHAVPVHDLPRLRLQDRLRLSRRRLRGRLWDRHVRPDTRRPGGDRRHPHRPLRELRRALGDGRRRGARVPAHQLLAADPAGLHRLPRGEAGAAAHRRGRGRGGGGRSLRDGAAGRQPRRSRRRPGDTP